MIQSIPYYHDNYAYVVACENNAILFDCGEGNAINESLGMLSITLDQVIITHDHHDHVGGLKLVLEKCKHAEVLFPEKTLHGSFQKLESIPVEIIATPGHTLDHICVYLPDEKALITGDTLFAGGCGRCFSGELEMFAHSLELLSRLPGETQIYPAHEYLASNVRFLQSIGMDCSWYENRLNTEKYPSVGICLEDEIRMNPFLRAAALGNSEGFTRLRKMKDQF